MSPPKYKDIAKASNDLMNNDYCFDRKVKLKSKTANGVELTSEMVMKSAGAVSAKFTSKFSPLQGIDVDKLCVTTEGRFQSEVQLKNAMDGLNIKVAAEDGAGKAPSGKLHVDFKNDQVCFEKIVDVVDGPTVNASATVQHDNIIVGAQARYNTSFDNKDAAGELKDYNAALAYKGPDWIAAFHTTKKGTEYHMGVHHRMSKEVEVATSYQHTDKLLSIGGIYKADDHTKFQGKISSAGIVSMNIIQQIQPQVKFIASAQVDAKDFNADSHKFGLQMILG